MRKSDLQVCYRDPSGLNFHKEAERTRTTRKQHASQQIQLLKYEGFGLPQIKTNF